MSNSDSEEDSCTVYWKTDSLLLNTDHKHTPRLCALPVSVPLVAQTPVKPKRDTTSAHLPSPSTSAARKSRPLRLSKRRKPEPVVDPHPFDDKTLKTIGMLATRLSGRSSTSSSLTSSYRETASAPRSAKEVERIDGKGKGREVAASPLTDHRSLPVTTRGAPGAVPPRASASEPTLHSALSTTKPFPSHSKPAATTKAPPANAPSDDDEFDDASFELAASQLESLENLAPVHSSTKKTAPPPSLLTAVVGAPKTRLLQEQQNPTRSSPRFVQSGPSTTARPTLPPAPVPKPLEILARKPAVANAAPASRQTAATAGRPPAKAAAPPRPPAPPAKLPAAPTISIASAAVGPVVVRGGGAASAKAKREQEAAAAKEIATLLDGAENWSDDDDF